MTKLYTNLNLFHSTKFPFHYNIENIFLLHISSLLELYRQHVSVKIEVYFKKCVSRQPSASGYTARCCVVIHKGNLILKVQRIFWGVVSNFRTCQVLTPKGNVCACAQRFIVNENNKKEGVL